MINDIVLRYILLCVFSVEE